jgi:hypothetical protein
VLGQKRAAATDAWVTIDAFDVRGRAEDAGAPAITSCEQDSSLVAWLGDWTQVSNAALSGGTHIYSTDPNGAVRLSFYGSGVSWIGCQSAAYGKARVTLDGASTVVALTTDTTTRFQRELFSASKLDPAKLHELVVEPLGPTSGGTNGYVSVDRIDVSGGWAIAPQLPSMRLENTAAAIGYEGSWTTGPHASLSGGTQTFSKTAGSSATLQFEGTEVRWVATKAPNYGLAEVWLDGEKVTTVDLYAASRAFKQTVFSRSGLPSRPHTLTVKVLGQKRAAATDAWVTIDAFDVRGRAED